MKMMSVEKFKKELWREQRSKNTIKSYSYAVKGLLDYLKQKGRRFHFTKDDILLYIEMLNEKYDCKSSANNRINAINKYLKKSNNKDFLVRLLPSKKNTFLDDDEIFTDEEIELILKEAKKLKNKRLYITFRILLQTGIRVYEMRFITYKAVVNGLAMVTNKGRERPVPIPADLKSLILDYCKEKNITSGPVIITRNNKPVDRSYLYRQVHRFITSLGIAGRKAHPHAFRHKFAINYLSVNGENAISNLADILGHKNIETTRIYLKRPISEIRESMELEKLGIKIAS